MEGGDVIGDDVHEKVRIAREKARNRESIKTRERVRRHRSRKSKERASVTQSEVNVEVSVDANAAVGVAVGVHGQAYEHDRAVEPGGNELEEQAVDTIRVEEVIDDDDDEPVAVLEHRMGAIHRVTNQASDQMQNTVRFEDVRESVDHDIEREQDPALGHSGQSSLDDAESNNVEENGDTNDDDENHSDGNGSCDNGPSEDSWYESDLLVNDDGVSLDLKLNGTNWESCNDDILLAKVPSNRKVFQSYVRELHYRGKVFHDRGHMQLAWRLYATATVALEKLYEGDALVKDDDLATLYKNRALLSSKLGHKPYFIQEAVRRAFLYCTDLNSPKMRMEDFLQKHLSHFPDNPGDSGLCKYYRIWNELNRSVQFYDCRMAQLGELLNLDSSGSPITAGGADDSEVPLWDTDAPMSLPQHEECTWAHLDLDKVKVGEDGRVSQGEGRKYTKYRVNEMRRCANCSRTQITLQSKNPFHFDVFQVCSLNVKQSVSKLRAVQSSRSLSSSRLLNLCSECHIFLRRERKGEDGGKTKSKAAKKDTWSYTWPSFYWNLLTGSDARTKVPFHQSCGPATLWRFIPDELREYWRPALKTFQRNGSRVYDDDTLAVHSHFRGRTMELKQFWGDIHRYEFEPMLRVMDPQRLQEERRCPERPDNLSEEELRKWESLWQQSKILPDVLCPWGCSEFFFRTKDFDPSLLLQYHLRTVQLNLPGTNDRMHLVETSRLDYIRDQMMEFVDLVLLNDEWPILPTMLLYPGKGPVICTCRHHCGPSQWKRLCCHAPKKPGGMNLSACRPDQLCHAKLQPRVFKPLLRRGINTVPMLSVFTCGYAGADCATVTTDRRWQNTGPKPMNMLHESLSLERPDIVQLADTMLVEGDISKEMYDDWLAAHEVMAASPGFRWLKRGATYTPTVNAIHLQLACSVKKKVDIEVKERLPNGHERDVTVSMSRSWCPTIGNMQVEDLRGYGWPMKAISFAPNKWKQSAMFTWSVLGMISSLKELYHIVDQSKLGHSYKTPSGHLLTFIHHKMMKHCDRTNVRKSPFHATMCQSDLCSVIENYLPDVYSEEQHKEERTFMFGPRYFKSLFREEMFPKVHVVSSVANLAPDQLTGKDVLVVVSKEKPHGSGSISVSGVKFEAKVALSVSTKAGSSSKPDHWTFDAVLYCRWGGGYSNWWCQHRCPGAKAIMLQSAPLSATCEDPLPCLPDDSFYYVVVYCRDLQVEVEDYKLDVHRSLGGQCSVFCTCRDYDQPLIMSGIHDKQRRVCMSNNCERPELYCCSRNGCKTRICERCYDAYKASSSGTHILLSPDVCADAPVLTASDPSHGHQQTDDGHNSADPHGMHVEARVDINAAYLEDNEMDPGLVPTELYNYGDGDVDPDGDEDDDNEDDVHANDSDSDCVSEADDESCDSDVGNDEEDIDVVAVGGDVEMADVVGACTMAGGGDVEMSEVVNKPAENSHRAQIAQHSSIDDDVSARSRAYFSEFFDRADESDVAHSNPMEPESDRPAPVIIPVPAGYYDEDPESDRVDAFRLMTREPLPCNFGAHGASTGVAVEVRGDNSQFPGSPYKQSKRARIEDHARLSAAGRHDGTVYSLLDRHVTTADYDDLDPNLIDDINVGKEETARDVIPRVTGAEREVTLLHRNRRMDGSGTVPMHVLFNQAARMCNRYNKSIDGTRYQKNFVQKLVSTIFGYSFPMLYFHALLFPKHFWSNAQHDKVATLGCAPISCFTKEVHPDGFASTLEQARVYATHASSSASTDDHFATYLYSMQANAACSTIDSRLATRSGFTVSTTSSSGLQLGSADDSDLAESLESSQGAMNLAAAANELGMDAFITYTPNQRDHPGLSHLHKWKESRNEWGLKLNYYDGYPWHVKKDCVNSMEMAYTHVLTRCWLEVRKFWLEFIIFSVHKKGNREVKVSHAFFRDEYQDCSGNLSHIHGLFGLFRGDMNDAEFREFVCSLQANSVGDIIQGNEVEDYISRGLLKDDTDWTTLKATARTVLGHTQHNSRCLRRKDYTGIYELDYTCRKLHPVFDSHNPLADEFQDLPYVFSDACLDILSDKDVDLYKPPGQGELEGTFKHKMLKPKRHVGKVHPHARDNMSPVMGDHFAFTRSMQNYQVITGTNGVTRYVVKYVIKLDKGNRCIVWADSRTGEALRAERQFIHNSKITSSSINEKKAFELSRQRNKPQGRYVGIPQMLHQLLGYSDIHTTMKFETIETTPFEYRGTTKIKLDKNGNLVAGSSKKRPSDLASLVTDSCSLRASKLPAERHFTVNQKLLLQPTLSSSASYDKITLFGLRPVEMLKLFPRVRDYYKWFVFDEKVLSRDEISEGLKLDVTECQWIDALGRRVRLRKQASGMALSWLKGLSSERLADGYSFVLRDHLVRVIEGGCEDSSFIYDDEGEDLPIVVFSRVLPNRSSNFLLHMMLVLGEFETELDLKNVGSMRESLFKANLISDSDADEATLRRDGRKLLRRVFHEILPLQPVTMPGMDDFIVRADQLIQSVLLRDSIPITDLPPSILSEVFNDKNKMLDKEWKIRRSIQLDSILSTLQEANGNLPSKEAVMDATKLDKTQVDWDPLDPQNIPQGPCQTDDSREEQMLALRYGKNAVDRYCKQFCNGTHTKGILNSGAPGAGKTFVLQAQGLYAMTKGLRVMSTSLMAVRSNAIGGYHLHRLFQWQVGKKANLFRLAELALERLNRKTNMKFLHLLLTMDVLLLDECGQLSAQQFALIDIILRHARSSALPFGGVLIFGTFDHHQLGAIEGLPFLLSSHILTDFTLVKLEHSVRAAGDEVLKRIQKIARMSPYILQHDEELHREFVELITTNFKFVDSFGDPLVTDEVLRLYHRRKSVSNAMAEFVRDLRAKLDLRGVKWKSYKAKDMKKTSDSAVGLTETNDTSVVDMLDNKVREPRELLFYPGAVFAATANRKKYAQSQTMLMIDMPTDDQLAHRLPIKLFAAPPVEGALERMINRENLPTKEELLENKWTEVQVDVCDERLVTRAHTTACRRQYTLVHVAASTVNKQMGNTLYRPCAIEVTEEYYPWERGQVVVELSRNKKHEEIIFVGQKTQVAERLWQTLCIANQWTFLTESIVENLSHTVNGRNSTRSTLMVDVADNFPFRIADQWIPDVNSGFVYLLISTPQPEQMYVGTTENLAVRINQHNRGYGSEGTACSDYLPWAVAAYMSGMSNFSRSERMAIENEWQQRNMRSIEYGHRNLEQMIENGRALVTEHNEYNEGSEHRQMNYIVLAQRRFALESAEVNGHDD